jgi:hypothetical protein
MLTKSAQNCKDNSYKIFTGIDTYGRGAYAGGQFNSYKGVQKIKENKTSFALFAPCYVRNDANACSREAYMGYDEKLWFGYDYITLADHNGGLTQSNLQHKCLEIVR